MLQLHKEFSSKAVFDVYCISFPFCRG